MKGMRESCEGACGSRAARGNRGESESKGMKQNETEENIMKKTYLLEGLDCANCAAEVERNVAKLDNVNSASVNFLTLKMVLDVNEDHFDETYKKIVKTVKRLNRTLKSRSLSDAREARRLNLRIACDVSEDEKENQKIGNRAALFRCGAAASGGPQALKPGNVSGGLFDRRLSGAIEGASQYQKR